MLRPRGHGQHSDPEGGTCVRGRWGRAIAVRVRAPACVRMDRAARWPAHWGVNSKAQALDHAQLHCGNAAAITRNMDAAGCAMYSTHQRVSFCNTRAKIARSPCFSPARSPAVPAASAARASPPCFEACCAWGCCCACCCGAASGWCTGGGRCSRGCLGCCRVALFSCSSSLPQRSSAVESARARRGRSPPQPPTHPMHARTAPPLTPAD